jgi:hypothetical protein
VSIESEASRQRKTKKKREVQDAVCPTARVSHSKLAEYHFLTPKIVHPLMPVGFLILQPGLQIRVSRSNNIRLCSLDQNTKSIFQSDRFSNGMRLLDKVEIGKELAKAKLVVVWQIGHHRLDPRRKENAGRILVFLCQIFQFFLVEKSTAALILNQIHLQKS